MYRGILAKGINTMKINTIIKFISIGLFILISGIIYMFTCNDYSGEVFPVSETENLLVQTDEITETPVVSHNIVVHVCGAVKNPGVYDLPSCSRICDAVSVAGGFKKNAAETEINLAKPIEDGEQIYIPSKKELQEKTGSSEISKLNINSCTMDELTTLPGIGKSKAESIIQYREEHGYFKSVEEIKNIQGIKDGVYNKIIDYIVV